MVYNIIGILVKSPFYPHWLEFLKMRRANDEILKGLKGDILEVGAGEGSRKIELLKKNKDIKTYILTDYSSWDNEFEKRNLIIKKYGEVGRIFFDYKKRVKLDRICSATELPFEEGSFDAHLGFEVLEHIDTPEKYFSEATRILRKDGLIIFSVPFLSRMHGGEPEHKMDFFRYANGFFYKMSKDNNLEIVTIYNNAGFGTTFASMANQWLIRKISESFIVLRIIFIIISPLFFAINNIIGYIVDIKPDKRFATRFHVVMRKIV